MSGKKAKDYKKIIDDKILKEFLPEITKLGLVDNDKEFCQMIELIPQNLISIKTGTTSFTMKHIILLSERFNMNPNWVFGYEKNMFRKLKTPEK